MRRLAMLAIVGSVLLVAFAGVAWAANITCLGGLCTGTEENDRITGSQLDDQIRALGGRDHVTGRMGDDEVFGDAGADEITGGVGGDLLIGDFGPDEIGGGPGTSAASVPPFPFDCRIIDEEAEIDASTEGNQVLFGSDGNDVLEGGSDNDFLSGDPGRNDLFGKRGEDCLDLSGAANERVMAGDGDDIITANDGNGDDVFCGAGNDTVEADEEDRVASDCEEEIPPTSLQAEGSTPEAEVTITTP